MVKANHALSNSALRCESFKSISVLILFVNKLMIGSSKNNRENYPRKCFLTQEKETRVKFNPGLSANREKISSYMAMPVIVNSLSNINLVNACFYWLFHTTWFERWKNLTLRKNSDATITCSFPFEWCLSNEHRNSMLMMR